MREYVVTQPCACYKMALPQGVMDPTFLVELPHGCINPGVSSLTFLPTREHSRVMFPWQPQTDGVVLYHVIIGDLPGAQSCYQLTYDPSGTGHGT